MNVPMKTNEPMKEWMSQWSSKRANEGMNEWVKEQMSQWQPTKYERIFRNVRKAAGQHRDGSPCLWLCMDEDLWQQWCACGAWRKRGDAVHMSAEKTETTLVTPSCASSAAWASESAEKIHKMKFPRMHRLRCWCLNTDQSSSEGKFRSRHFKLCIYLCMGVGMPITPQMWGGQRASSKSLFSPSTMWVSGIKLRPLVWCLFILITVFLKGPQPLSCC